MDELEGLKNIGPQSAGWLRRIGITRRRQIAEAGPVTIYRLLRAEGYPVTLNLVYALEGALQDLPWNRLPAQRVAELKAQVRKPAEDGE